MTDKNAKKQGYTHAAKIYGLSGYFNCNSDEFAGKNFVIDFIVEAIIYVDLLLRPDSCFKIKILRKLKPD